MKRRTFFKNSAFLAALPVGLSFCSNGRNETVHQEKTVLDKVKTAMLSMQRASWEHGVAAQAFLESGDKEMTILFAKEAALRQLDDGRLSVLYTDNGITDPAASGEAVLYAANELNDSGLRTAADKMLDYLLLKASKSENGIIYHTLNSPEFWIDSMYMVPPFLAAMGKLEEAIKQIHGYNAILWNKEHQLYSHRWHDEKNEFINEKFWGVGNGWALAGISRVIDKLTDDFKQEKEQLMKMVTEHLDSCLSYMRSDGLFHDIMDDQTSFVETNLGQMIAYTIYTGIQSGWLDKSYQAKADKMRQAAHSKVDEFGFVQDVCGAPYFNGPGRATEGQAFFILMEAAYSKMTGTSI